MRGSGVVRTASDLKVARRSIAERSEESRSRSRRKRAGQRDSKRVLLDLDVAPELAERVVEVGVEVGDRDSAGPASVATQRGKVRRRSRVGASGDTLVTLPEMR
jgi:hypothetical protein